MSEIELRPGTTHISLKKKTPQPPKSQQCGSATQNSHKKKKNLHTAKTHGAARFLNDVCASEYKMARAVSLTSTVICVNTHKDLPKLHRLWKNSKGQRKQNSSKRREGKKNMSGVCKKKKLPEMKKKCWDEMGTNKYFSSTGLCCSPVNIKISHPIRATPPHVQT